MSTLPELQQETAEALAVALQHFVDGKRDAKTLEVLREATGHNVDVSTMTTLCGERTTKAAQKQSSEAAAKKLVELHATKTAKREAFEVKRSQHVEELHALNEKIAEQENLQRSYDPQYLFRTAMDIPWIAETRPLFSEALAPVVSQRKAYGESLRNSEQYVSRKTDRRDFLAQYLPGAFNRVKNAVTGEVDNVEKEYAEVVAEIKAEQERIAKLQAEVRRLDAEERRINELLNRFVELRYQAWPLPSQVDAIVREL